MSKTINCAENKENNLVYYFDGQDFYEVIDNSNENEDED